MTNLFTTKTNFTGGELSQDLLGRVDLRAYDNGAMKLENVFIQPTGGIYRRPGLKYIATLPENGRLIPFEISSTEAYLVILQQGQALIYRDGILSGSVETPWTREQIPQVRWTQGMDSLYLTHPNVAPRKLTKTGDDWTLTPFSFLTEDGCIRQPYHKFCHDDVTLASSGLGGDVTLTASSDVFLAKHIGKQFKIAEGYVEIKTVTSPTKATAKVLKQLITDGDNATQLEPTRSWGEAAFDDDHGWPVCVAFYQSRLVFGGSASLPNRLWFSQSGDLTNFELGSGYDAEAIDFNILADQSNAICALFAGRHLQVFTTSAEWMVSGDPLTPANIQLKRQTQVGSPDDRFVPPIGIDGATIFPAANGREIREFLFADIEQAYQATDLSLLAGHLIHNPIDQAYDKHNRQAYIIMDTGNIGVLTSFRSEDLQSWTCMTTAGAFKAVCICGTKTYFIVERDTSYLLEQLDESVLTDCAVCTTSDTPQTTVTGLSVLNSKTVKIKTDGVIQPDKTVTDNTVTLDYPATSVETGIGFAHVVVPLPPVVGASNGTAPVSSARLVKAIFRVVNTASLEIDTGTGFHQEMTRPLASYQLDNIPTPKTTDVVVRSLGWNRTPTEPLWQIRGDTPKSFGLVSVTSDIQIGG